MGSDLLTLPEEIPELLPLKAGFVRNDIKVQVMPV